MNLRWLIYILIAILMIAIIWRNEFSDNNQAEWTKCKESLVEQVFLNNCTPNSSQKLLQ